VADGFGEYEHPYIGDHGSDVAAAIVQEEIDDNGTDGANNFEVEIVSPEYLAGIYDITLEWEPRAVGNKREAPSSDERTLPGPEQVKA